MGKDGDGMQQKKILYCASTASHLMNFHLPYMKALQDMGYTVDACVNKVSDIPYCDDVKVIPFAKKITSSENIKNIIRVYQLLKQERYDAISVHTTLAAAVVRAGVLLLPKNKRPKVFNTCHGYLFNKQDGIKKWKYLLPELICAPVTDVLMAMNQEDKEIAEQYKLYNKKHGQLISIPGMGVDFSRFDIAESKAELRKQYGIAEDAVLYTFAGEFSNRKNQTMLIHAFAKVAKEMPKAKLILAGDGAKLAECKELVESLNLQQQIVFPGYVTNMPKLYRICDVCISASKIEGLPFNIMEAMYCQMPCIVSDVKGHRDLVAHGQTGYLFKNEVQLSEYMLQTYQTGKLRERLGQEAKEQTDEYKLEHVYATIVEIYERNM